MDTTQKLYIPNFMKDDNVSQECKNFISSLPSNKDSKGFDLYKYQGCWYYPNTLQAVLNVQKYFKPRDTDIILASLPKGGTTWLKSLAFAVVHRRKYHEDPQNHPLLSQNPHNLVPFLELELYARNQSPDLSNFPSHMLFSTHMHFNTLREAITKYSSSCKIVYVCRDIKDTLVSGWYYRNMLHRAENTNQTTLDLMFDSYCKGVHSYGPYWEHVLSYWKGSLEDRENVFFMKYEEIIKEPRAQIKRLAMFLDYPFTKEEEESGSVEEIIDLCSLRNLRDLSINKNGTTRIGVDSKAFFRKGEVNDWKYHLTPHMAKTLDEIVEYKLRGSGLRFQ